MIQAAISVFSRHFAWRAAIAAMVFTSLALSWGSAFADDHEATKKLMIEKGREVFLTAGGLGCMACHGPYAEGDSGIGPFNRGVGEEAIRAALASIEPMMQLREELTDEQIKQIAAYYEWLGQLKLVKTLVKRGRFLPNHLRVHPGTRIQLVVNNASVAPHRFVSDDMGFEPVTVAGREAADFVWVAPDKEGTVSLRCEDCGADDQKLTIEITRQAPKFVPVKVISKVLANKQPAAAPQPAAARPDPELTAQGRQVFLNAGDVGCVACHGRYAEGDVGIGPYNRGFSEKAIRTALAKVRAMSFMRDMLDEEQIKQVAAYYESLSHQQLVKTHVVRGVFIPDTVKVHPGTEVQLVVMNPSVKPRKFASPDMQIEQFVVAGRDAHDFVWQAPEREGSYTLQCVDCPIEGQKLTIEVSYEVPAYTPPVALK